VNKNEIYGSISLIFIFLQFIKSQAGTKIIPAWRVKLPSEL